MSILFNGSTSYVDCGNVLDSTADMTMSCWLKLGSTGVFMDIASKEDTSVAQGWEFFVLYSGEPGFGVFNTTYAFVSASSTLTPGTVYHICGIRDSAASVLRIYINGSLSNSAGSGGPGSTSTANMNIGRSTYNSVYLDGVVGDFRVYNRVLSPDEINALYVARGRDRIFNGLVGHYLFNEQSPGTTSTAASYSVLNYQSNSEYGTVSAQIQLSYTVPSGLTNPVLIVVGGAENATFANCEPTSCTFGATGMTKRAGSATTVTYGAGSAIFTLGVSAGASQTITLNFAGTSGDGNTGRIIQAFVVEGALDSINTSSSSFNNSGNTTIGFTTTAASKLGIVHLFTGANNAFTGTTGTGFTNVGEVVMPGGSSQFSSRVGVFNAATAQSYSGYGYTFTTPAVNRSAASGIALNLNPGTTYYTYDRSNNSAVGTMIGGASFTEGIY